MAVKFRSLYLTNAKERTFNKDTVLILNVSIHACEIKILIRHFV